MGEEPCRPDPGRPRRFVTLGRVIGAHGIQGALRVRWLGDGPENLLRLSEFWLAHEEEGDGPLPPERKRVLAARRGRAEEVTIGFEAVDDRDQAEALRGRWVLADAAQIGTPEDGGHYWFELIGCRVLLPDGTTLGTVRELWETGAHDVLVVEGEQGERHLIPAVDAFVREIDLPGRSIRVEPIPGLLDPV